MLSAPATGLTCALASSRVLQMDPAILGWLFAF